MTARDQRASFFPLIDQWPSLSERRRSLVLRIVRALSTIDMCACFAIAKFCDRRVAQAATREADRAVRQIRNRIRANEARQAIRRSLMEVRKD